MSSALPSPLLTQTTTGPLRIVKDVEVWAHLSPGIMWQTIVEPCTPHSGTTMAVLGPEYFEPHCGIRPLKIREYRRVLDHGCSQLELP